jgi:hypothetical protein
MFAAAMRLSKLRHGEFAAAFTPAQPSLLKSATEFAALVWKDQIIKVQRQRRESKFAIVIFICSCHGGHNCASLARCCNQDRLTPSPVKPEAGLGAGDAI